jgi:hypothetical protein
MTVLLDLVSVPPSSMLGIIHMDMLYSSLLSTAFCLAFLSLDRHRNTKTKILMMTMTDTDNNAKGTSFCRED